MSFLDRYANKWMPEPNTGCYLWLGRQDGTFQDRPRIELKGKWVRVARIVCEEANGPPPTTKHQAAHNTLNGCVGGLCVNGGHLRWATALENMRDEHLGPETVDHASTRAEAMARGLKHYFTGKPCTNGHRSLRFVGGECVECRRERQRI